MQSQELRISAHDLETYTGCPKKSSWYNCKTNHAGHHSFLSPLIEARQIIIFLIFMRARWEKQWFDPALTGQVSSLILSRPFFWDTLYYPCTRRQANVSSWLFAGTSTLKVWTGSSLTSSIRPGRMLTARLENLKSYILFLFILSQVVFLNKSEPDLEFEGRVGSVYCWDGGWIYGAILHSYHFLSGLLKREKTRVTYFQGTMLK